MRQFWVGIMVTLLLCTAHSASAQGWTAGNVTVSAIVTESDAPGGGWVMSTGTNTASTNGSAVSNDGDHPAASATADHKFKRFYFQNEATGGVDVTVSGTAFASYSASATENSVYVKATGWVKPTAEGTISTHAEFERTITADSGSGSDSKPKSWSSTLLTDGDIEVDGEATVKAFTTLAPSSANAMGGASIIWSEP